MPETQDQYIDFLKKRLGTTERLLSTKQYQVDALLDITRAINNNFSTEALYKLYEYVLVRQIHIDSFALFVKDEDWQLACELEVNEDIRQLNVHTDIPTNGQLEAADLKNYPKLDSFDMIVPVKHKEHMIGLLLAKTANGNLSQVDKEEKIKFLQALTNIVMVAIENKKLFKRQLDQEVMKKEMELGANMQMMLIPKDLPDNDQIEVAAEYLPNRNVGGDYYDFLQTSDQEYTFCISDISGKGIAAALLMANFQANIRTLVNRDYPLQQLVDMLNHKVNDITKGEKFITFFIGRYEQDSRRLRYINAGHNPPILYNDGKIELLKEGSTILGIFDTLPSLSVGEVFLEDNALLVAYTDGLTDLENQEGEFYEMERLTEFVEQNNELQTRAFNKRLLDDLITFKGPKDYIDDVTLLTCRFR